MEHYFILYIYYYYSDSTQKILNFLKDESDVRMNIYWFRGALQVYILYEVLFHCMCYVLSLAQTHKHVTFMFPQW